LCLVPYLSIPIILILNQQIYTMDYKQIQELIKLVNKSNIGELTIEENGQKLTIKQKKDPKQIVTGTTIASMPQAAPVQAAAPVASLPAAPAPKADAVVESNLITVKSPMIGTFYRKPSPDKPNFVEVGTEVAPGKVVCIIEAMKLFNEIECEIKGTVVKILVEDNSPVEYDQPLFLVEP
jgi:acetyl-CoA carboxylase biotin carboxyl carrier protein